MLLANAAGFAPSVNALIFAGATVVVWLAGTRLTKNLATLADRLGLEQAFAGALLLGTITSLPEIANVLTSASAGHPALAVNNLLGSASINLVLLALADAAIGRDALTAVVAKPATMLLCALCMLVLTLVAIAVSSGDVLVFGVGLWSIGLFIASIAAFRLAAQYAERAPWKLRDAASGDAAAKRGGEANGDAKGDAKGDAPANGRLGSLLAKVALAGAVIFAAGYALAATGEALAQQTGLGSGLVGFLLIGFATSTPELSTIVAALRLRRAEMALGEVLGSNFVNLSLILLADVMFSGGAVINELGRFEAISALLGVLLTGSYLIGLLERRNPVLLRMGYDSVAVLLLFAGGVALLFVIR